MDKDQLDRFGEAVEEKKQRSKEASEQTGEGPPGGSDVQGDQSELTDAAQTQDVQDPRAKNTRKGKVTADKWNQ